MPNTNHQKTNMEELIEDICANVTCKAEPRDRYSGRGMYGEVCYGIVTSDATAVIEQAAHIGLLGAVTDSMGRDTIVYWPQPKVSRECMENYPGQDND